MKMARLMADTMNRVMSCLPQLQCRQCGYDGCRPYARALLEGATTIDRCLPGGSETLIELAKVFDLDPASYCPDIEQRALPVTIARIDPMACVGCRKCIDVCPQDAIVGASGLNHALIPSACSGCGLCVPACPMDCISLHECDHPIERSAMAPAHLARHDETKRRQLKYDEQARRAHLKAKRTGSHTALTKNNRLKYMQEALARVNQKKNQDAQG